jgi:hypothetical protein
MRNLGAGLVLAALLATPASIPTLRADVEECNALCDRNEGICDNHCRANALTCQRFCSRRANPALCLRTCTSLLTACTRTCDTQAQICEIGCSQDDTESPIDDDSD